MSVDDPDSEILSNAPTGGIDVFEEAMGASDSSEVVEGSEEHGEYSESTKGGDMTNLVERVGDGGGTDDSGGMGGSGSLRGPAGVGSRETASCARGACGGGGACACETTKAVTMPQPKPAPKITLRGCLGSAKTSPSLRKTVGVSAELFGRKKEAFHNALQQTLAAKDVACQGGGVGSGASEYFDALANAILEVEGICTDGKILAEKTLDALDDAVIASMSVRRYNRTT